MLIRKVTNHLSSFVTRKSCSISRHLFEPSTLLSFIHIRFCANLIMGFWNRKKSHSADAKVISTQTEDISTMDALEKGQLSGTDKFIQEKIQDYSQTQLKKEQSPPSRDVFTEKSPTSISPKAIHDPRKDRPESPIRKAKRDSKEKERSEDQLGEEELQTKEKKVLKDIEDVRGSMDENIRKMIERGERVEAMGNQMGKFVYEFYSLY